MAKARVTVSATEARRSFSKLLRAARDGASITITKHGKLVAELIPAGQLARAAEERQRRLESLAELIDHLKTVTPQVIGRWTREEIYDRR